jgi:hypothetical protein
MVDYNIEDNVQTSRVGGVDQVAERLFREVGIRLNHELFK